MNMLQKQRVLLVAKIIIGFLIAGISYMVLTITTGLSIPCVFYEATGFYCPGCGLTRFCKALCIFEWEAAARANLLFFVFFPILLGVLIVKMIQYIRTGKLKISRFELFGGVVFLVFALAFAVLRNIEAFAFLRPL